MQVDGKVQPGVGVDHTVGSLLTLPMGSNCTLGNRLSPSETGRCTLLISSANALNDIVGSFTTDCTLSPTISSTSDYFFNGYILSLKCMIDCRFIVVHIIILLSYSG